MRYGKLAAWLSLVGALALLNYASRFTSGKPPADYLYRYDNAISGLVFYALTLGIVLLIARGLTKAELGLQAPDSWPRALGLTLSVLIGLLIAEGLLESILHGAKEQGLEPSHWEPSKAVPFALNAAVVVIAAPIVEELFFRGLVLRSLERRVGTRWAIVASAALFGAAHLEPLQFPALFLFGLVAAVLTVRSGRLGPSTMAHVAFNGIAVFNLLR